MAWGQEQHLPRRSSPGWCPSGRPTARRVRFCREDVVVSLDSSLQVDRYFVVRHPLVPPVESPPGGLLDDGMLVIVPGEPPDRVQAGEPGDGGEHGFAAVAPAQEPGTAEPADRPQMFADLRFAVTLVIVSSRLRRPSAPYPRSYAPHSPGPLRRPECNIAGVGQVSFNVQSCRRERSSLTGVR